MSKNKQVGENNLILQLKLLENQDKQNAKLIDKKK
jgi:hypothetical protein